MNEEIVSINPTYDSIFNIRRQIYVKFLHQLNAHVGYIKGINCDYWLCGFCVSSII